MTPTHMIPDAPAIFGGRALFSGQLRFIKPTLPDLRRVLRHYKPIYATGVITNADLVERFETAAAERLGVDHCVAVSSCTSGLALVMRALQLKGEVILPSFTFFATGHAVRWNGLKPVFADCDPETWNLDPASVEAAITERTSAIVAVHLYGNPCNVEALSQIASRHGLKLIYDSAHGFGSSHQGRPVGQFGDAEVFSFSPTKLLVAGEGGLVSTNDAVLAHRIRAGRNYGDLGAYDPELIGLNARMSEFNAALALAGLDLMERKIARHNEIANLYTSELQDIPGLRFQRVLPNDLSTYKD
jgi:dTDP-4-amino-4,6-dideoxygalactose transaminase